MYLDMIRIGEKSDGKLLIFITCLQKEKEKKKIQSYIVKKKRNEKLKKKMQTKEVHELSSSQD